MSQFHVLDLIWISTWNGFDHGQILIETATHSFLFSKLLDQISFGPMGMSCNLVCLDVVYMVNGNRNRLRTGMPRSPWSFLLIWNQYVQPMGGRFFKEIKVYLYSRGPINDFFLSKLPCPVLILNLVEPMKNAQYLSSKTYSHM